MRILQISDPHLVAADAALVRERPALRLLERALEQAVALQPDLLPVSYTHLTLPTNREV